MDLAVRKMTLGRFGVENVGAVHENLPPARLVEAAVRRREGMVSGSGALVVRTGKRTGRSPKDRFIVENDVTRDTVDWGTGNKAFSSDAFGALLDKAAAYIENLEEIYVVDAYAGADPRYSLNVHVVTEHAWQALFARQLFRRPSKEEIDAFEPDWTVISVPGYLTDPEEDGTESETFVGHRLRAQGGPRLRHGLRRRDQEEHLHGLELRAADRTRRLPDALLGQHGQRGETWRSSSGSRARARRPSPPTPSGDSSGTTSTAGPTPGSSTSRAAATPRR